MVICPDCGKDVPESKFCKNCGAYIEDVKSNSQPQAKARFCAICGNEIDGDYSFCPECGADIPNDNEDVETEVPAEPEEVEEIKAVESGEVEDVEPIEETESVDVNKVDEIVSADVPESEEVESVEVSDAEDETESLPVPTQPSENVRFCFNCGYRLVGDYKFCPECGQDLSGKSNLQVARSSSGEKNILLAIILSVFLPGLGQIYLGLDHKGAIFLIAYVISAILILIIIGFLLCFVIWIWALIDTIISTNALNRGEEVKDKLL